MHELSIARAIVDTVIAHAEGRPVSSVQLRIGRLRQVVPESMPFYFEIAARETLCDGARLDLELIPARLRCQSCGADWDPAPPPAEEAEALIAVPRFRCPECGQGGAEVIAGEELDVESIEVEEERCTARR